MTYVYTYVQRQELLKIRFSLEPLYGHLGLSTGKADHPTACMVGRTLECLRIVWVLR